MLKKLKNEHGVSMILLIVIIIIMMVIFAVTFSITKDLVDSTKAKKYATVMYLIRGEITARQDEADFMSDDPVAAANIYIGQKLNTSNATVLDELKRILEGEVNRTEYDYYYNVDNQSTPGGNGLGIYEQIIDYWYVLDKNDLASVGIDTDFADDDTKVFIVNYVTGEIIYTPGVEVKSYNPTTDIEEVKSVSNDNKNVFEYTINGNVKEAVELAHQVQDYLSNNKSSALVSLAIEEMLVNIINTNKKIDAIDVIVRNTDDNILISIKDNGIELTDAQIDDMAKSIKEMDINNIEESFKISIGSNYFPNKKYKGVEYKEGYYDSVVIELGESSGLNWWCVIYPPLCKIDNVEEAEYTTLVGEILSNFDM